MRKFYLLLSMLGLLLGSSLSSLAQISHGGTPLSVVYRSMIDSTFDEITISPINLTQVRLEDSMRTGPLWAGRSIPVALTMENSGTWETMPNGSRIWRLKITSAGAKALGVTYDHFYIPEGGQLFLYNATKTQIIGSFTSENNTQSGIFSNELVQGETVILEYVSPAEIPTKKDPASDMRGTLNGNRIVNGSTTLPATFNRPQISISEIVYVYRDVPFLAKFDLSKATGWGASDTCQVNVNCSEGTAWQTQKKGVAEIFIKNGTNYGWCTGALINTTNNSGLPYFLTADHCHGMPDAPAPDTEPFASAADMLLWQFYFKYESATCTDPAAEPSYSALTGGCTLKASSPINGGSDFCLVLLEQTPPQSYNPYYEGWDRSATAATSGVGIHHPAGDIKKISTFSSSATTGTFNGGTGMTGQTGACWNVAFVSTANGWSVTEGGSSGSPLFNQAGRQVGTLSGGNSTCVAPTGSNLYGKFVNHWDLMGPDDNQRLKPWLDPTAAGVSAINGYDPFSGFPDFYGTPTLIYEGQSVTFTDITNGATTWAWSFEGGTPATSTAQVPGAIFYYQQGTYKVKLTTTTPTAGLQSQEKIGYITVQPGSPPTTFWCDNLTTPANWTISTGGGYTDVWAITTAAPAGTYSASLGRIASSSAGNYALFDSDAKGSAGDNQWTHITTTTGKDCSAYGSITLKFEQNYRKFYDSTLVYVSTDNFVTSTRYVINGDYANNDASANPDIQYVDISSAASGKTNVKIRFTFRSTQNMSTSAGWGYAWEVDDVCLIGVAPGNDLPVPDFTATTIRDISPGQSVSYQDLSQLATSWLWTFEGGTPATSTAQNPTNIVYNTGGYYAVTLTATNQNGAISTTKTDYIHVFDDCSYDDSNIDIADEISYYFAPGTYWGYTPGHNGELITTYADKVTNSNLTGKVKSFAVAVGEADIMGGATNVNFKIWSDNAGAPGTELMSWPVAVSSLDAGYINIINFAPISVSNTFYVGFQIDYPANLDTFACYISSGTPGRTGTAWVHNGTSWVTYESKYGVNCSLYILPEFCLDQPTNEVPVTDFFASQTAITPGTTISYTDQSTGGPVPTSWSWTLPGGNPGTSTVKNPPAVLYNTEGLYNSTLAATNANGTDTELKASYIHVAPVSNIVYWNFPNATDNATADGGITANLTKTLTNWGAPTATTYNTAGASTSCAATTKWDDANAAVTSAWSATFTTLGYTNIKLSSKQSAGGTTSPRDFEIYYAVNGGDYQYLTAVPQMTTAGSWTQGVVNNVEMPADCENAASVEVVWYKVSDISASGGAVAATAISKIDDILITGQLCDSLPGAPGTITGSATVCQGATGVVYTVPAITSATIYNWTVPTGATIVSGNYTRTITVDFAQNQAAGNITVQGENLCGLGTISANKAVAVTPVPVSPGTITGLQTVSNGQNGVAYSVTPVGGATSYTWTTPSFATISGGATTSSITVNYACPGDFGSMSVHANNACGAGPESYIKTIGIVCPPVSNFYASATHFCPGGSTTFTDISTNNPTSWSWTFTGGTPATSTLEHPTVTYASAGTYAVTLTVTNANGSDGETKTGYIVVAVPAISFTNVNENPAAACNGTSTANATGSSPFTYNWNAFSDATSTFAGTTGVTTNNAISNFTAAVTGIGNLDGTIWSVNQVCISATGNRNPDMDITLISPTGTTIILAQDLGSTTATTGYVSTCFKQSAATSITTATEPFTGTFRPVGALTSYHTGQNPNGNWTLRIEDDANQGNSGTLNSWNISFNSHIQQTTQTATALCSGTYTVTVTDANGCTASQSTVISASSAVTASITASTNVSCFGGNTGSATVTAASGTGPYSYDWSPNGFTGDGTVTYSALTAGTYTVTVTDATAGTATASIVISQPAILTAAITAQTNATCLSSTNGSATVTGGGGTAPYVNYDWAPNGFTGDGTATYSALTPGSYTVTITDNKACTASTTAVITALNANAPVSVSIAAVPAGAICAGTSVTFTATPTNGGAAPAYQWKVNGVNVGIGLTYTTTTLATGNTVTCVLTSNATCATGSPATSNTITMTVNAIPVVSATATPATVCNGTSSSLTGSGATTYTWMPGSLSGTTVSVTPAATTTYTVTGTTSGCTGSNTVAVTVNPLLPVSVSIAAVPAGAICPGTSVTFTATPANGGAAPAYQWKVNGGNVGTGNTYTSTTLANLDAVTCVLTSNATCPTGNPATSNAINMTVNPALPASVSIAAVPAGTICSGTSVTFTATPTNGGAAPAYQWKVNGTNVGTGTTYTSSALTTGQMVTCVLTSNATCVTGSPATSNTITMDVQAANPVSVSIAAVPSGAICAGTSVTFTATPTNGGAAPVYQWYVAGTPVGGNSTTYTSTTLTTGQIVTCSLTSNATCPTGNPATSNAITMTVNPNLPVSASIAAVPSGAICAGTSVTFTVTPTNGGAAPAYQWKVNGGNVGTGTTYTSTTLANLDAVTCVLTSNATCATGSPATSNTINMAVNPNLPVSVSIAAAPAGAICAGTSVTFTATPTNGGATPAYQWKVDGTNVGTGATYTSSALTNTQSVTCVLTSNATCPTGNPATSNAISMTVNPNLPVSVSIAAVPPGAVCTGTSVTFTATPVNGGAAPVYQWYVAGSPVGGNSTTYTSTTLTTGQVVTCSLTSNAVCPTGSPATSNAINMTVNSSLPASVSIAAVPSGAICAGTSVTFTATPTNGGSTPTYQWKVNGTNVGTGVSYTSTTLTTGNLVTCVMTSSESCATGSPATSNTITMSVNPNLPVSVSIAAAPAGAICAGTSVTFTATPTNGGAAPVYQWYVAGAPVGGNSTTYTSTTLTTGQIVTCSLTSNATCPTGNPATSNAITMTVNPNLPVSVSIAAVPAGAICPGTSVTFTATPTNGGAGPAYQWLLNGANAATGATYTSTTLATSDIVTCILTSNATCATGSPATSNAINMTVNPNLPVSVSIAAVPAGAICAGTSVTLTASPTNGGAAPAYQWKVNGINAGTGATLTSTTLAHNDLVTCILTSNATCATGSPATSNAVTMSVNPNLPVSVSIAAAPASAICAGTSVTFTATPTNGGVAPIYQWYVSGSPVGGNSTTYTSSALTTGQIVTCSLTSNAACPTGNPATSNAITMTVNPNLPVSVSIAAVPAGAICPGTSVTFTPTPVNGGTPAYQWKVNGTNVGTGTTFTSTTLSTSDVVTCILTSNATCATGSPATSNAINMTVNPNLPVSVSIAAVPAGAICAGTSVAFTASPVNGGATPAYDWKLNGISVGTGTTYTNTTLATSDIVTCVLTSNALCATGSPATSNAINMTVNPNLPVSVSIAAVPAGAICPGTSVTFTASPVNGGATPAYDWKLNGTSVGTGTTYTSTTIATSDIVTCVLTSNATCATGSPATSNAITMTVNPNLPVSVSIAAVPAGAICPGTSVTFTPTPVNGGTPAYQWKVNGTNVGTGTTFTSTTLSTSDVVTCILTSNATCATGNPATSNAINMTVNPNLPVSVSIAAVPAGAICAGTSVVFTASPVNGGATPAYDWKLNGTSVGTGTTYTSTTLATSDIVTCILTSNALCATGSPATSNAITMTVNPNLPVSVSIAAVPAGAICPGTSVTFTASPVNGGATPAYDWKLNGTSVGTGTTYTSTTLATSDIVTCVLTSNATCATGSPATSNAITMTVNPNLPVSLSIAAVPAGAICPGTSVTFTPTPVNGGTPAYQWKVNGTNVGTGTTFTSTTLSTSDVVTCILTSNATCATGSPATSNAINMTVNPNLPVSVSIAAVPAGAICAGTSVAFTASPVNGGATPAYDWKLNGTSVGTGTTYTSTTLATSDIVTCILTSNALCATGSPATSNAINMTVNPNLPVSVSIAAVPAGAICPGTSVTFTASPVNGGATPAYDWKLNGTSVGTGTTYTSTTLATSDIVTCVLTSNATCATGSPATSNAISMTVNPNLPVSVSIAAVPAGAICPGTSVTFTPTPVNGGTPAYQWKVNGTNVGTGATYTSSALTHGQTVNCILTSNATCATGSPATSNTISMTVNPNLPVSVSIAAVPAGPICPGTSVTFTPTPVNGGTPAYQWKVNGTNSGTGATFTSTTLSNLDAVTCELTSNAVCATGSPATSNAINMTVNPNLPVSVSIAAVPAGAICAGTSVAFTASPVNGGATPAYDWKLNGTSVGTGTTYTNTTLATSDIVTCVLTSNATCATGSPATSNAINMTVNPNLPVSVSIAAVPAGAICPGTSVTFTASPVNGGATPAYDWKLNGTSVGTGTTYTSTTLATSDIVTCVLTSNATCATGNPATSNALTMTVNQVPLLTLQPVSSTIGAGGNASFSIAASGTGLTYQWQVSTDGGIIYNDILASGIDPSYSNWTTSVLDASGVISGNDGYMYRCNVTGTCSPVVTSTSAILTVNNAPAITSHPANAAICTGYNTSFTVVASGTITGYQWQLSTDGGTIFNNISAAGTNPVYADWTTATLNLTGVITGNNNYQYRCIVTGPVPPDAVSNAATLTVNVTPAISVQPVPATVCEGLNTSYTVSATGNIWSYQWQVSTDGGTIYNNITLAGASPAYSGWTTTTLNLSGVAPANNGYLYRCMVFGPCLPQATSNGVLLTVNPNLPASVIVAAVPATAICTGTNVAFTATPTNGGATPVYQWQVNGGNAGTGATYNSTTLTTGDVVTCILTSNATCATTNPATSNAISMTVNPNLPVSVSIAAAPAGAICSGTSVTFTATPTNGGAAPAYQWKVNGSNAGTGVTFTSTTLSDLDAVTCELTSNATCATGNPATSNTINMMVNPNLPVNLTIAAVPAGSICTGTNVTFTATPVNGGLTPAYQWQVNGVNVGSDNPAFTSNSLSDNDQVTCILTSDAICATGSPATSNIVDMTVNPNLPVSVSIAAVPAGAICAGTNVTFTASPVNGGTPSYQWYVNGTPEGINSATFSSTTLLHNDVVTCALTSSEGCATGNPATSNAVTISVNPGLPVSVSIGAVPAGAICAGTSVTFTAIPVNGGTTPAYQWKVNGSNAGTGVTFTSTTLSDLDAVTCELASNATCATGSPATSNTIAMTVNPNLPVSVSIAAVPAGAICTGTNVTFTATPVNGGITPTYTWKVNGTTVGSNSTTYSSIALVNGDVVTCALASSEACNSGSPAVSNAINMTVNSSLPVSVSIAAVPAGAICAGTNVTFTATPVNGGTPSYQWYVNGTPEGLNSATFSSTTLLHNDVVTCALTSSEGCATGNPATSNAVTISVNPGLPVSVSIGAVPAGAICAGTSVTFTAIPVNGGTTPAYQWKVNGSNAGTGVTFTSTTLSDLDAVTCELASNATCATGSPATSNTIAMTVNPILPVSVSIAAVPAGAICTGTNVTFTATPVNGGITPTYTWKVNGTTVGSNSTTYSSIALVNGDVVTCALASSEACNSGSPAVSNAINMTVNSSLPVSVSIAAVPAGAICAGTNVTFTATPVNGGTPSYQWYVNGTPEGINSATFSSTTLLHNDVVTCALTSSEGCATGNPATSNAVTISVNPGLPVSVSIGAVPAGAICAGTSVTFTAIPVNGGTTPAYQWKVNGSNAGTGVTFTSTTLSDLDAVTCELASNATCATGSPATSNTIAMTVNPILPVSVSIAAVPAGAICTGTNVTFTATPVNGGITPTYTWKVNGTTVGSNSTTYSSTALVIGDVVTCALASSEACNSGSPAVSNAINMTVNSSLPVSVSIAAVPAGAICAGTNVTFTATPVNGGTPSYQWYVNGTPEGLNSATFSSTTLLHNDVVTCALTSSEGCATGNPATSNAVTMVVNPNLAVGISIAASPAGPVCDGTPVTFTATPVNEGTSPVYQWNKNGVNVGASLPTYTNAALVNGDRITCSLTSNIACASGNPANSNVIDMTVNPNLPVSISIAASPATTICAGTNVTFTATAVNGGVTPVYAWAVNGISTGSNSATFASSTLANSDVVTCTLTSSESCTSGNPATSNAIGMTVNPNLPVSVTVAAVPAGAICAGTSVTFNATAVNGGSAPVYSWTVNGSIAGSNSATFTSALLANNDAVICTLVSNESCATGSPATSNTVLMTVNPNLPVSVSIAANPSGAICEGTPVNYTATPVNGGATPSYQWMVNGVGIATGATYNTSGINNGDVISCALTSNATCATGSPATSNSLTMSVTPSAPVSISIIASPSGPVCAGTNVSFVAVATNGGTTPAYQWLVNGISTGNTTLTYNSTTLLNGDVVTCLVTSNVTCASGSPATSNAITMTVNPNLAASISIAASPAGAICDGTPVTFTATPVNAGTVPIYQWKKNGVNVGSDLPAYTNAALVNGDLISCTLTSDIVCATGNPATSNTINMVVNPNLPVSINIAASPATIICAGTNVTFTASAVNGGAAPVYQWLLNSAPVGFNSATYSNNTLTTGDVVSCNITSNATCATGSPATSNAIGMTVSPNLPVSITVAAVPAGAICSGTNVTFMATAVNGGVAPVYAWAVNGISAGSNSTTFASSALANSDVVTCTLTSSESCTSDNPAASNAISMVVNPNAPASISIVASPSGAICEGSTVNFTANPVNEGSSPAYQWMINSVIVGTSATYTTSGITDGDMVSCVMTSNATCATGSPATSNTLTMSVNPLAPVSVTVAASPNGAVCPGTNVTFIAIANNGGTTPAYQWLVNGTATGITTMSYNSSVLNNGDEVSCIVTSSATCAAGSPATSNTITMSVTTIIAASVNITAVPAGAICEGTPVTITATPTGGGTTPAYQWILNGIVVGTGTSYSSSILADNDQVLCVMSSNATCITGNPAISNPVIMEVNPILSVGVSIAASPAGTVCAGTNVTFTATPIDAGASPNYQWVVNGINLGSNSPTYTNSSLSTGDQVQCILTATAPCATGSPATSGIITMDVTPTVPVSISVSSSPAGAICEGSTVTFTATPVNGGITPTYQWMVNGSYAGSNAAVFSSNALLNGDIVICNLISSATCPTGSPASSTPVTMTVNPNLPASVSIVSDATGAVCQGTNINFTATPVNGGVSPSYQWMVNGLNVGSDNSLYAIASLNDGDVVSCQLTSSEVCATNSPALSNAIALVINASMPVGVTIEAIPAEVICAGDEVTFSAIPTNSGFSPLYEWYLNGLLVGVNASTYTTTTLVNGDAILCVLTSSEVCATGSPATSGTIAMTVNQIPVADAGTSVTTCSNVPVVLVATGGSTYAWSIGEVGDSITVNPQGSMTYYVTATDNGCSSIDFVDVLVLTAPNIDLGSDAILCGNQSVLLDAGANYQTYDWSDGSSNQTLLVDSASVGLGAASYNVNVTAFNGCQGADTIEITIQSCAGITDATEDVSINFYPNPVHGVLTLSLNGLLTEDVRLSIIDILGQVTFTEIIKAQSGETTRQLDMSSYATGVYYLNIQSGERSYVHKLIVN